MRAHLGKETVGGGAMLLAMVAMAACSSEECLVVNGADVWTAPHSMPLCVRDDLVVEGRNEAEFARLEQVIEISGSLLVHNNAIARLPALTALRQIGDGITIAANPDLTEIAGFPGLKRVPGTLYIGENQQLAVLDLGSELRDCGDNGGEETALTPCPWPEDDICDEATGSPHDTGLCAADPEDCAS